MQQYLNAAKPPPAERASMHGMSEEEAMQLVLRMSIDGSTDTTREAAFSAQQAAISTRPAAISSKTIGGGDAREVAQNAAVVVASCSPPRQLGELGLAEWAVTSS